MTTLKDSTGNVILAMDGASDAEIVRAAIDAKKYLHFANLQNYDLSGVDLSGVDFSRANLVNTNFTGANLTGTCLDPNNPIPPISNETLTQRELIIDDEYVVGYRTRHSQHCGSTEYVPGNCYAAPWFSTSLMECHPGIYMDDLKTLRRFYGGKRLVMVKALRSELFHPYPFSKFRAKRVWVLEDVNDAQDKLG